MPNQTIGDILQEVIEEADTAHERLSESEAFWRDLQPWLSERGYLLRRRYQPGWVPSWLEDSSKNAYHCEDSVLSREAYLMDTYCASDGRPLMLKQILREHDPYELEFLRLFNSEPYRSEPRNHCVPIIEFSTIPDANDKSLVVMPQLLWHDNPPFYTIGESVDFFDQIFTGLQYFHSQKIAHNDCKMNNILMDGLKLFSKEPHPFRGSQARDFSGPPKVAYTRTQKPVEYFFIDFGLSRRFSDLNSALVPPGYGGDDSVPEFKLGRPVNPFPVDVYCLGNMIRETFTEGSLYTPRKRGFEFMEDLVASMVQDDPAKRPNMDGVVSTFHILRGRLSWWKLRSRVIPADEHWFSGFFLSIRHLWRTMGYIITRKPAIPSLS